MADAKLSDLTELTTPGDTDWLYVATAGGASRKVKLGNVRGGRSTFSNADYTILATDRYVAQVGTMSAARTATLPAANAVAAGHEVTIADESNTVTGTNTLTIQRAGSDTILNPHDMAHTTSMVMKQADTYTLTSDGTSKWVVTYAGLRRPYLWFSHQRAVALPTGKWVPLPWNNVVLDAFGIAPYGGVEASTTIAVASNGAALPQTTINVADTSAFASSGFLTITGPPAAGKDTVVAYTGKTATTFTGCNSAVRGCDTGISTGTLATSQVVRQAFVECDPPTGYLYAGIAGVCFENVPTTARNKVRFVTPDGAFNLPVTTQSQLGTNEAKGHVMVPCQPGLATEVTTAYNRIDAYQDSGGVLYSVVDGFQAPIVMMAFLTSR